MINLGGVDGCFNKSADAVTRIDRTWGEGLDKNFDKNTTFERLKCRNCDGLIFEVLVTGDYETSAKCVDCGMYYIVHSG